MYLLQVILSDRDGVREQYRIIASTFVEEKVDLLMFETFSSLDDIVDVIKDIKKDNDIYIHNVNPLRTLPHQFEKIHIR